MADGGTLFLDEVAEMGVRLQAKFLRVLQEQQFERVGGDRTISVDVRVIAATNKDLSQSMAEGSFRGLVLPAQRLPDPYSALAGKAGGYSAPRRVVPRKISARIGKPVPSMSREAGELLLKHNWPGNVRELANAIERALIVSQSGTIEPDDLPMKREPEHFGPARHGCLRR